MHRHALPLRRRDEIAQLAAQPPTADDVCRTLEQAAAENALPVEFFARLIWQESRFDARAVSSKGAKGIAQFMPHTANSHGLGDPFNPIEALRHSAAYLRSCVSDSVISASLQRPTMQVPPGSVPGSHTTVTTVTAVRCRAKRATTWPSLLAGRQTNGLRPRRRKIADTTIPQGLPCTRLANLVLAPTAASSSPPQTGTRPSPRASPISSRLRERLRHRPCRRRTRPSPRASLHFFIIAATDDENEHPSDSPSFWLRERLRHRPAAKQRPSPRCRPPPGSESVGFVIAIADGEHDHPPARRQSPPGPESGFVIAVADGEHDDPPGRR